MSKFTPEQFQDYLKKIREMAEGPFEEMEPEVEQTDRFPQRFFDLVQESGIYRCALPEEYGGYGMNDLELVKVQEEYSRGPGGIRMYLHYAMGMNWRILHDFAGEEMKKEFMPKFQDATIFTCFGLTEETGGTGADLHTTAVLDGDEYVINGEKTLISYAQYCNYAYVFAVTNPESKKDDRLSAFLVPMDTPGMEVLPMPRPMGCRGAGYGKLSFYQSPSAEEIFDWTGGAGTAYCRPLPGSISRSCGREQLGNRSADDGNFHRSRQRPGDFWKAIGETSDDPKLYCGDGDVHQRPAHDAV